MVPVASRLPSYSTVGTTPAQSIPVGSMFAAVASPKPEPLPMGEHHLNLASCWKMIAIA